MGLKIGSSVWIFFIFLCSGRGNGSPRRGGGGDRFLLKTGGVVSRRGRGRGAGRVSAANWGILRVGQIFFSGPKRPPRFQFEPESPNRKKKVICTKSGFPPMPARTLENAQKRTFLHKKCAKVWLCTLLSALSGIDGNPTFCAD